MSPKGPRRAGQQGNRTPCACQKHMDGGAKHRPGRYLGRKSERLCSLIVHHEADSRKANPALSSYTETSMSPRKTLNQDRTRFTLWVTQETLDDLERAQHKLDKGSVAEVIRDAIDVYLSLLKARNRNVRLFFEDKKSGESGRIWLLPGPPPV